MPDEPPFNPLDKRNLGVSVAQALLAQPVLPLAILAPFTGAGIYVIYYVGNYTPYQALAEANRRTVTPFSRPIYVGKAVPEGTRKGGFGLDLPAGSVLFSRLNEHATSVRQAQNLDLADFSCRYLVVDDIWIPLGEALLIQRFSPLWNQIVEGFGNHDPGSGRAAQKRSPWDTIHPGRPWAARLPAYPRSEVEIMARVQQFLVPSAAAP